MSLIRCLQITNEKEASQEMGALGVDSTGIERMQGKTLHLNLKVEDISPRTANLLKQEMLALGETLPWMGEASTAALNPLAPFSWELRNRSRNLPLS